MVKTFEIDLNEVLVLSMKDISRTLGSVKVLGTQKTLKSEKW